jgi:hypothetical protein
MNATTSSAQLSKLYEPGVFDEPPWPRRSRAYTRWSVASSGAMRNHVVRAWMIPCTNTIGGASSGPATSYAMVTPSCSN